MIIGKILVGSVKILGKAFNSKAGKSALAAGTVIGVGLAGNGVRMSSGAKKKNRKAIEIKDAAIARFEIKQSETNQYITKLAFEEKRSTKLIDEFLSLTMKIHKCPSLNEIDLTKIDLPLISYNEIQKMSKGLDLALSGVGGTAAGALPGIVFFGANLSALGLGALSGGIVLSIKGSKLSKIAVDNLKQANKISNDVDSIVDYCTMLDGSINKLTKAIIKVNNLYDKKLMDLSKIVETNNNYEHYDKNDKTLVKNIFKLTILLANMCNTKLVQRKDEVEYVDTEELDLILNKADSICKQTRQKTLQESFI